LPTFALVVHRPLVQANTLDWNNRARTDDIGVQAPELTGARLRAAWRDTIARNVTAPLHPTYTELHSDRTWRQPTQGLPSLLQTISSLLR